MEAFIFASTKESKDITLCRNIYAHHLFRLSWSNTIFLVPSSFSKVIKRNEVQRHRVLSRGVRWLQDSVLAHAFHVSTLPLSSSRKSLSVSHTHWTWHQMTDSCPLKWSHFYDDQDLNFWNLKTWFSAQVKEFYIQDVRKVKNGWGRCIALRGEYTEGD